MKVVDQVVASTAPGDAVTEQAFAWRGLLRHWGFDSEVIAEHVHPGFAPHVLHLDRADARLRRAQAVIAHYSVWSRVVTAATSAPGAFVLSYHNITPGELLRKYNSPLAALCDRARNALHELRRRCTLAVADSSFNAEDLRKAGIEPVTVVPLLLNLPRRPFQYQGASDSDPLVLFVGRIAPNKRLEDALNAFRQYQMHHARQARFVLVGSDDGFERYRSDLERRVSEIGAQGVIFAGRVSREERDDFYRQASVYLSTSVHEGFCAPLVEALAHGIPVVARAAGAVPETLGEAGILLDTQDSSVFADALHEAVTSPVVRASAADAGARRLRELQPESVGRRLRAALEPLLESL